MKLTLILMLLMVGASYAVAEDAGSKSYTAQEKYAEQDGGTAKSDKKSNVHLTSDSGIGGTSLVFVEKNPYQPADLLLKFHFSGNSFLPHGADYPIDMVFHNATEADWVLQYLKQTQVDVKINLNTSKPPVDVHNPKFADGLPDGMKLTDISNYSITTSDDEDITVVGIPNGATAAVSMPVTVEAQSATDGDDFTDVIRHNLEQTKGKYAFGKEGDEDMAKRAANGGVLPPDPADKK